MIIVKRQLVLFKAICKSKGHHIHIYVETDLPLWYDYQHPTLVKIPQKQSQIKRMLIPDRGFISTEV